LSEGRGNLKLTSCPSLTHNISFQLQVPEAARNVRAGGERTPQALVGGSAEGVSTCLAEESIAYRTST
jgi:hypothetical protein